MELLHPTHRDAVGESPLWLPDEQALYWVDIEGRALNRLRWGAHTVSRWALPERIGCIARHAQGGLVAALERRLVHLRCPEAGELVLNELVLSELASLQHPRPDMRFNDGRCDRQGRFWAGTMVLDMHLGVPAGSLYRCDAAGLSAPLLGGFIVPNGLAFSPSGQLAYFSDSHPSVQRIWRAPLRDDGSLGERELFVDMAPLPGRPDGAAVDAEGGYWICGNDGGVVHRFTPKGQLERSLRVPVSKPSMCCFAGPLLDHLVITSIRPAQPLGDDAHLGGAVFITRPGVVGLPETPFRPLTSSTPSPFNA